MRDVGPNGPQPEEETATPEQHQEDDRGQAIKTARGLARQAMDHLRQGHVSLGAVEASVGLVDVITHLKTSTPILNYATPSRHTARVGSGHINDGLTILSQLGRKEVFIFPDLLFPSAFNKTLIKAGLQPAFSLPIWAYTAGQRTYSAPVLPTSISIQPVSRQQSMRNWWYIRRHNPFQINASILDQMQLSQDLRGESVSKEINLVVRRYNAAIGAARITLQKTSAHIATTALLREVSDELGHLLLAYCLQYALGAGRDMVFISSLSEKQGTYAQSLGFVDVGNIVCYAESATVFKDMKGQHGSLAQPVSTL